MPNKTGLYILLIAVSVSLAFSPNAHAQQTLGGITGTVADKSGGVLPETMVTIVGDQTKLTRTQKTNSNGSYDFVNLPIGTYTLTFTHEGFESEKIPSITVQADRTATVNPTLPVGKVGTVVEVQADPLLNAVDTTNGYVLEKVQIEAVPLPTGSFTGLAILSPGVSAELAGGTGANSGLGNQPIWANGQRDTSNSFLLNGVDASNLFNGKSTSQVASARIVNNTGVANAASTSAAPIQSTASVYLAVGQALPTPAPETIQELRVNTSMYDAQQGSTSGAHIDMSTASGTNVLHGSGYIHRGTDWLNAAPFFDKQDPNIPANDKVPQLHRYTAGGTLGGALIKDKLFGFVSYQHLHDSDQEIGLSRMLVPKGLSSDRSPGALANISNLYWGTSLTGNGDLNPIAVALFQYKLPNGQFLIPSDDGQTATPIFPENAISPGTAYFTSDQAVADLDWTKSAKEHGFGRNIITSTIRPRLRMPTPTSPDSLSIWMRAVRSRRSPTRRRSGPISALPRFWAFFAKKSTARLRSLSRRSLSQLKPERRRSTLSAHLTSRASQLLILWACSAPRIRAASLISNS